MRPRTDDRYPLAGALISLFYVLAPIAFAISVVLFLVGLSANPGPAFIILISGVLWAVTLVSWAELLRMVRDTAASTSRLRAAVRKMGPRRRKKLRTPRAAPAPLDEGSD